MEIAVGVADGRRQAPGAMAIDAWVAAHGPIWPAQALMLALDICSNAARMSPAELRSTIGSLAASSVVRQPSGDWSWVRTPTDTPRRPVTDGEVIERIGVVLFCSVTGATPTYPLRAAPDLRAQLRSLRPDIHATTAGLVVRAMTARGSDVTLAEFAQTLRHALALDSPPRSRIARSVVVGAAAAVILASVLGGLGWTAWDSAGTMPQTNGLTNREATVLDVSEETAQAFVQMDEHTAAIQVYQEIARLWRARIPPEDPRLTWNGAHESWVRWLRGDGITTEQNLVNAPTRLDATIGRRHPYSRAVRVELAAALEKRGGTAQASALRAQADSIAHELLHDASRVMSGVFAPPGIMAHVAPNRAELEGFRQQPAGRFFKPVTSMQRLIAGRDGWRLHLVAGGACRTSAVLGDVPRRIAIAAARRPDGAWRVQTEGIAPPLDVFAPPGDRVEASLIADGAGSMQLRVGDETPRSARIDDHGAPPEPPFSLVFAGDNGGSGCAVVWLEIPVPFQPPPAS